MIYFPKTRYPLSRERAVTAGKAISEEGRALIQVKAAAAALGTVEESAGGGSEVFAGFAVSDMISPTAYPKVEQYVITGGIATTVVLARTPQASSLSIQDSAGVALVLTTDYTISGATVTWVTDQTGKTLSFFYRFALLATEVATIFGHSRPGGAAGALVNQVGVIREGVIYTGEYDTLVNWNAANPVVKMGASGRVTIGGGGVTLSASVIQPPFAGGPDGAFLGLEFNV